MYIVNNIKGHFNTITSHKKEVMRLCFKLGLYKQGIMHDLSKYSPQEFLSGVIYYTGNKSPNTLEKQMTGMSEAWLHHKGRNKHHYEYWIDHGSEPGSPIRGMRMPVRYVVEMFCDRIAAGKVYYKDKYHDGRPLEYFLKGQHRYTMHPDTKRLLGKLLVMLKKYGEEETLMYVKHVIL
ncbi:MAG: catalase [Ruminiclostridium sp.]|nr:catalase [Ruminiclostridium sp.]